MNGPAGADSGAVAVVGAGISGLVCARVLTDNGLVVRVFDKGRGVGGRMSTRRAGDRQFDHGAQYFTARDSRFERAVKAWCAHGLASPWNGKIAVLELGEICAQARGTERFVGVPTMDAICRYLAEDLNVTLRTRVASLERSGDAWSLAADDGAALGRYGAVVVSAPGPQAASLLAGSAPAMAKQAGRTRMTPCWAAMISFGAPLDLGYEGAFVHSSALSWIASNASKPGRARGEHWVLHASPAWSSRHLELDSASAANRLVESFRIAVGGLSEPPIHVAAHRWRLALPTQPLPESCLYDAELRLGACGDWCDGPRVEGAFLSGIAMAGRLLGERAVMPFS